MKLLSEEFLSQYGAQPKHMSELGAFVAYRTYTRWIEEESRRETWKEAVRRAVEYNVGIAKKELESKRLPVNVKALKEEAQTLFDNIFNLRQFLSGRTHWVGGAESDVAEKFPLANFNCSFVNITKWSDLSELFYLLLVGTGVGFKSTAEMAENMESVRRDFTLIHAEYEPVEKSERLENTNVEILENGYAIIRVGDSKEGWVKALEVYFEIISEEKYQDVHTIKFSYNSVRPNGERLKTFGGTASGHEPLQEMIQGIYDVLNNNLDPTLEDLDKDLAKFERTGVEYYLVRPIHILDIGNLIGNNVVVGGVRRTAEIFLADADDWEVILAKYGINGIWDEAHHQRVQESLQGVLGYVPTWLKELELNNPEARPMHHRRMSNNSVGFQSKPSRELLNLLFVIMQGEGEPGFVNLEAAGKRRPNAEGINPCAEIMLDSYGVCNLTTINAMAFVTEDEEGTKQLDFSGIMQAQALSARAGMRMTCLDLELPHWDEVHKRDRLIGTSITGWQDAMHELQYSEEQENQLLNLLNQCVKDHALNYSNTLRIPLPLLDTTIKPEGTLSQVAGGVSSGLHHSHSPYYIRRIRINATDPLVSVAKDLGWRMNPEVGQTFPDARTVVIDFPVKSGATKTKDDVYIDEQFDTYFNFQEHYTSHNSSNTIHVRPNEWVQAEQRVWDGWDDFIGVSFLAHDGGSYELAPYEAITEEEYHRLKATMQPFSYDLLVKHEESGLADLEDLMDCAGGFCAIR